MKSPVASACLACSSVRNLVRVIISVLTCSTCTLLLFEAMMMVCSTKHERWRGIERREGQIYMKPDLGSARVMIKELLWLCS